MNGRQLNPVVVLGTGCAALAVVAGVPKARLINHTLLKPQEVSLSVGGPVSAYGCAAANDCLSGASLVVNTTTLDMEGHPLMQINLAGLLSDTVVTDIAYTLLMTSYS